MWHIAHILADCFSTILKQVGTWAKLHYSPQKVQEFDLVQRKNESYQKNTRLVHKYYNYLVFGWFDMNSLSIYG